MPVDYVSHILELMEVKSPLQAKKFKNFLVNCDALYFQRANRFFSQYERLLNYQGKDFAYSIDCFDKMMAHMLLERINFLQTNKYSNNSFKEVQKKLYENPDAFDYHMHGLALAQFIWIDQYYRFGFFSDNLSKYKNTTYNYLEIGGGHGLYISEALQQFSEHTHFDLVDISPTSIEMSKQALNSNRVNYILKDIYEFIPDKKYDFITIGEVIEHLEKPQVLMAKLKEMLSPKGIIYLTTPANAPMVDHIYLFNSGEEIRAFIESTGFNIVEEKTLFAENMAAEKALKNKIPLMFAAFLQKNDYK